MRSYYYLALIMALIFTTSLGAGQAMAVDDSAKISPMMSIKPGASAVAELFVPIYYADGYQSTGSVYYAGSPSAPDNPIYTRPSGNIHSFAFHPGVPEKLYYVNANRDDIYMSAETGTGWSAESVIYTHNTYVRDIAFAFDRNGDLGLYFSEATGAGGDGKIYKLDGASAVLYYPVKLSNVGGYWSGDFAFDSDGNLYLSSGNRVPASIYMVESGSGIVTKIFESKSGSIAGLVYRGGRLYYADWGTHICRLDISTKNNIVYYTNPKRTWISDVGFKERLTDPEKQPKAGVFYYEVPSTQVFETVDANNIE